MRNIGEKISPVLTALCADGGSVRVRVSNYTLENKPKVHLLTTLTTNNN